MSGPVRDDKEVYVQQLARDLTAFPLSLTFKAKDLLETVRTLDAALVVFAAQNDALAGAVFLRAYSKLIPELVTFTEALTAANVAMMQRQALASARPAVAS